MKIAQCEEILKAIGGIEPMFWDFHQENSDTIQRNKNKKLNDFDSKLKVCEIDTLYPKLGHEKASQHKKGREKAIF